ncbi:hypothetical protein J4447_02985 [Candidatus Pacearchaeota archaeon]|nr:hypothetical protein [Candidatus Pacearchaeota archaeon]
MAIGMSTVGILAVVVLILALAVVLLGVLSRVKKLNTALKAREEDNVTPYIRTINYYKKGNFDQETKINALNKISKQFFRDLFSFNSEKTFDEISKLAKAEDDDIRKFCTSMGIARYSKKFGRSDIDTLYKYFEIILAKRKPQKAPEIQMPASRKPMSMEELTDRKMKKDILDIKQELSKMAVSPPSAAAQKTVSSSLSAPQAAVLQAQQQTPSSSQTSSSQGQMSVEEKLARITEEIGRESKPEKPAEVAKESKPLITAATEIATAGAETKEEITNARVSAKLEEHEELMKPVIRQQTSSISPNKIIKLLIKNAPVEKLRIVKQYIPPKPKPISIPRAGKVSEKLLKLPLKRVKLDAKDEEKLNREIISLNARLQRLVDRETERRIGEIGGGVY